MQQSGQSGQSIHLPEETNGQQHASFRLGQNYKRWNLWCGLSLVSIVSVNIEHWQTGKILEANGSKYSCRQILVHANPYRSYMSQAMSSRESQRSIPGNSLWSFWPFSRSSDLRLEDSKATLYRLVYLNHICVCFRAPLLAVWVLVKVSQGSQNLGGLAFCAKIWEAFPS